MIYDDVVMPIKQKGYRQILRECPIGKSFIIPNKDDRMVRNHASLENLRISIKKENDYKRVWRIE